MKTFKKLFFLTFCFFLCLACSNLIKVPLEADFVGAYTYGKFGETNPNPKCPMNVVVDGVGSGSYIGNSTVHFDFCVNPVFEDSVFVRGEYGDSYAYIVAENGDTLFILVEGAVLPNRLDDHPEEVVSYWRDPFKIIGGTGRYEGATGEGMTDDYNSNMDDFSHHHWTGTLTMVRGKR